MSYAIGKALPKIAAAENVFSFHFKAGENIMQITKDIYDIGVNDTQLDLFEGQFSVPNGMSYNSYVIVDEKIAVFDTVDKAVTQEWMEKLRAVLSGRTPDYLIIQHMEPDHSANILSFVKAYPDVTLVASQKAFSMMANFFGAVPPTKQQLVISDGSTLSLGTHELQFIAAPMVHWPEVMVTYDRQAKVLFSADGFGKFGTKDAAEEWAPEARRYYFGIVGKYGVPVQQLLKKAAALDIKILCPLHGPVLTENIAYYVNLYHTWSSYEPEQNGIVIAYTSVYGNTEKAVKLLAEQLRTNGRRPVITYDLTRCDMSEAVAEAFCNSRLVLATTTYNGLVFPAMRHFIDHLVERNFSKRTVAFIENGSWAPMAAKKMKEMLNSCKELTYCQTTPRLMSAVNPDNILQIRQLAHELCEL